MNKKIGKLQIAILLSTVLPMLAMGCIIVTFAIRHYEGVFVDEVDRSLKAAANSVLVTYDELYPGDYVLQGEGTAFVSLYKGEKELTGEFDIIDRMKEETGMEVTLFYKDARILTTLCHEDGSRCVATGVNGAVYSAMEREDDALRFRADINGTDYYVCYIPIYNSDGTFIGMIGTGRKAKEVLAEINGSIFPMLIVTILSMLVASIISIRYTTGIVSAVGDIKSFLQTVIGGKVDAVMNERTQKRNDEIGETGAAVVKMRDVLRVMVEKDPLTLLYNRRYGTGRMKNVQASFLRTGQPFAMAIGDIDFFKKVNDTYGHDAGDEVLKFVAEELRKMMLGCGFAVRWGGEEFLLVYETADVNAARGKIEALLEKLRKSTISYGDYNINVTMTMGLVAGNADLDVNDLIKRADAGLYYGKEHGRNQLVLCDELTEEDLAAAAKKDAGTAAAKKEAEAAETAKNDMAEPTEAAEKITSPEEEEYDIMKEFGLNPDGTPMKKPEVYSDGNDDTNELLLEELARSRKRKTVVDVKAKKPFMKVEEKTEAETIMASFSEQVVKNAEEGRIVTEETEIDEEEQKKDKKKKK